MLLVTRGVMSSTLHTLDLSVLCVGLNPLRTGHTWTKGWARRGTPGLIPPSQGLLGVGWGLGQSQLITCPRQATRAAEKSEAGPRAGQMGREEEPLLPALSPRRISRGTSAPPHSPPPSRRGLGSELKVFSLGPAEGGSVEGGARILGSPGSH